MAGHCEVAYVFLRSNATFHVSERAFGGCEVVEECGAIPDIEDKEGEEHVDIKGQGVAGVGV